MPEPGIERVSASLGANDGWRAPLPRVNHGRMWTTIDSPLGPLRLVEQDGALVAIDFAPFAQDMDADAHDPAPARGSVLRRASDQLAAYFAGELRDFDLPLAPSGTPFQRMVWQSLRSIPYGRTTTYGAIAERIGTPNAARAVGLANSRNPLPIVIACHRVIGKDGKLTGYAGGLDRKAWLLQLEATTI